MTNRLTAEREAEARRLAALPMTEWDTPTEQGLVSVIRDLFRELDELRNPEWLDAPTGDGWYWVEPPWHSPVYIEADTDGVLIVGGLRTNLNGVRVAPCTGRPRDETPPNREKVP